MKGTRGSVGARREDNAVRRLVRLGGWSSRVGKHLGRTVITPNKNALVTLGAPPRSLEALAREVLGQERIVHAVSVQRLLRGAVEEALGSAAPDEVARAVLPPVRKLFPRRETDLGADRGSARVWLIFGVAHAPRLARECKLPSHCFAHFVAATATVVVLRYDDTTT
jgi:hypothetical protein